MKASRLWSDSCNTYEKTIDMNDIDFVRITAMLLLPKCLETSVNPILEAVDLAEELLKECQKRENA